jgi:hypothetical protein
MGQPNESVVSQASINARAEALEKLESEKGKVKEGEEGKTGTEGKEGDAAAAKAKADKETADKAAAEKAEADKKAAEASEKPGKQGKEKKQPNDPDEMRKWTTRTAQENAKLRKDMEALKEAQDKTYKLLASLSKKPVDYKELAKSPENLEKFIEDERQALTEEFQEELERVSTEAKAKDTAFERMRREQDTENYPEWKRLYPAIVKIAMGPTGSGDPRVDFTKPAAEVLDSLYEIALQENPKSSEPAKEPAANSPKTFTEDEVKAMVADMVSKERESISKAAREDAAKEAQDALRREAAGSTVASSGKGAGRVPTDQLAAFRKMSLAEQRDWLIAQRDNQ